MEYQKFKAQIDAVKYTSVAAEYKRSVRLSRATWLNASPEAILALLQEKTLGEKFKEVKLFTGLEVQQSKVFVSEATPETSFEIVSAQATGWAFTGYVVKKQRNGGSKLRATVSFKLKDRTRTGLNGELGTIIWKWKSRKQVLELFTWLKKQFPIEKN